MNISRWLSYVLRHHPDSIGLKLREGGWAEVEALLDAANRSGRSLTRETLELVVATNDKQRFEFSSDGRQVRARQGHSIQIDLGYRPVAPPEVLYHGTASRFLGSILQQGLVKGRRHHVHLSTNRQMMLKVGGRHGQPVLLAVDAARMHAEGHVFYVTGNDIWLTDHVSPEFLRVVDADGGSEGGV